MFNLWHQWKHTSRHTKHFFFQIILYAIIILGIAIFAYVRLDRVRSYAANSSEKLDKTSETGKN